MTITDSISIIFRGLLSVTNKGLTLFLVTDWYLLHDSSLYIFFLNETVKSHDEDRKKKNA